MEKKGNICDIDYQKTLAPRAAFRNAPPIRKIICGMRARAGISYDNISAVIEKRKTGELPKENQGLPWGVWEIYPYTILHKGKTYFRFSPVNNPNVKAPKVAYFQGDTEITEEQAREMALESEFDRPKVDTFPLPEDGILDIR